ncbi:amidase signature domain-containing protein [Pyrenochaeta sp. MPI-SDFR-AT-0127]|nr:amidase signature domain-containing protein [Pyrenochaeta sp. MPI-SDFR-AT-0127]
MSSKAYQAISYQKRNILQSLIPKDWLLRPHSHPLPLDLRPLVSESNILTPTELSITSSHDATSLSQLIPRALDTEQRRTGKTRGPLHGIPVSLRDTFNIKGYDSSIGMTSLAEKPAQENTALVDILLEQGAVLYCKTNISQTLMALDSDNHIFGCVLNPRNTLVTAGGSSGGEGALLAMRDSVLGVGTDIGGSIRIPVMCNGLYSVSPSSQRVPFSGQEIGQLPGTEGIGLQASAGPIATSVRDCELFLKTIADARAWEKDPKVAFGTWASPGELWEKPLFGILRTDGITTPLPPVGKGAFRHCQPLANAFFSIGGHNHTFDLLEETEESLIPWLSTRLKRRPPMDLSQVQDLHARKTGRMIDALICPVAPHPVPGIDRWNDYPAATLPVRDFTARDREDELPPGLEILGGWDKRKKELWDLQTVDRTIYLNTKLSVQIVAHRLQERKLYEAMAYIDTLLKQAE